MNIPAFLTERLTAQYGEETARRIVRIADGKIIEDHPQEVDWY